MKGYLRLSKNRFSEKNLTGGLSLNQLSRDADLSYPTILKYINRNGSQDYDIRSFSGEAIFAILTNGMNMSPEEIANLKIGDVFEIVTEKAAAVENTAAHQ